MLAQITGSRVPGDDVRIPLSLLKLFSKAKGHKFITLLKVITA